MKHPMLLAVLYYLVVTPVGWLHRLASDPLNRKPKLSHDSYLIDCDAHRGRTHDG
uniref:Uncharacterized protein n=1 Tax=Streptomyces sp. NBC_00003 TaxID=2903608 RepID=A0AAU2UVZ8_9ACTN